MSILIKGMEMPKNCFLCQLSYLRENRLFCYQTKDEVVRAKIADNCPLVEIPPHGRLIDADALRQSIKEGIDECHVWAEEVEDGEMYARVSQSLGTFVECSLRVKAAPTIIPADTDINVLDKNAAIIEAEGKDNG